MPGCIASSTGWTFSAVDHRRRRCTEVITSTHETEFSRAFDLVVLIGECLCLVRYATCPVETGRAPILEPEAYVTGYGNQSIGPCQKD